MEHSQQKFDLEDFTPFLQRKSIGAVIAFCGLDFRSFPPGLEDFYANRLCRDGFDVTLLSQIVTRPCANCFLIQIFVWAVSHELRNINFGERSL